MVLRCRSGQGAPSPVCYALAAAVADFSVVRTAVAKIQAAKCRGGIVVSRGCEWHGAYDARQYCRRYLVADAVA